MKFFLLKHFGIIYIPVLLVLFSCGTENRKPHRIAEDIIAVESFLYVDNPDAVTIDNEKAETVPYEKLRSILKDVKYIPLVSTEPIGAFNGIIIYKDRIYVLDAYLAEKIFIFDMNGKQIKIIDSKGGAPQEYRGLLDMNISEKEECLVIGDRLSMHFLYFSLDGEFLKKERSIANVSFAVMNDGKIINHLVAGQSFDYSVNYDLVVTEADSVIRKGFPLYPIQLRKIDAKSLYYNFKNELLFSPVMSDTVYHIINDSTYTVKYIVKHRKSVWDKYGEDLGHEDVDKLISSNYTILVGPVLETESLVHYPVEAKMKIGEYYYRHHYNYWYNKSKGISFTLGEDNPVDYNDVYHIIPAPRTMYGNYYAGIIDPVMIDCERGNIRQEMFDTLFKNEGLKKMIMDENPDLEAILVLYEFKESW
jgi:hypothetical protein